MLEAMIWERWGCPVDVARDRPFDEFQAFAAIVRGMNKAEEREQKKADQQARQAQTRARR